MLITFSAVLLVHVLYLSLLTSLLDMSGWLVKMSPCKCVLLSTSKSVRKAMKLWDILVMVAFGRFSLMSGIWEVLLISLTVLVLVLFLVELVGYCWSCCGWCFAFGIPF